MDDFFPSTRTAIITGNPTAFHSVVILLFDIERKNFVGIGSVTIAT